MPNPRLSWRRGGQSGLSRAAGAWSAVVQRHGPLPPMFYEVPRPIGSLPDRLFPDFQYEVLPRKNLANRANRSAARPRKCSADDIQRAQGGPRDGEHQRRMAAVRQDLRRVERAQGSRRWRQGVLRRLDGCPHRPGRQQQWPEVFRSVRWAPYDSTIQSSSRLAGRPRWMDTAAGMAAGPHLACSVHGLAALGGRNPDLTAPGYGFRLGHRRRDCCLPRFAASLCYFQRP